MATEPATPLPLPVPVPVPVPAATSPWNSAEPHFDSATCYSKLLMADLLPGTFVLLARSSDEINSTTRPNIAIGCIVSRIVAAVSISRVSLNIFKRLNEVSGDFLHPQWLQDNNLRHLRGIVQMPEIRIVNPEEIMNFCFVFTLPTLHDTSTLAFTCQGMSAAFFLDSGAVRVVLDHCLMCQMGVAFLSHLVVRYAECLLCFPTTVFGAVQTYHYFF